MGRIDFFLGVFLLSLALPAPAPGFVFPSVLERSTFALTGTVFTDGTNQRIPSANLILCDDGGTPLQESSADNSGEFSFQGLRPGRYVLRVHASGFQDAELHIDLSFTSDRGLSVSLKPARTTSPPPPGTSTVSAHELAMPEAARNRLASGLTKLYRDKNPQGALLDFQSAAGQAPAFYEAFYQCGMAYLALQNPTEAEKQFRKSAELSQKKYADANIALGTVLIHRNEFREGEPLLRQGLAANPRSWTGQFELGELELSRGHLEPALAAAQTAAQLAPQQAVVYRLLAAIHLRQKNYPALITALDSYIELDPHSPAGLRAKELRTQAEKQMANSPDAALAVK
jgi:tetratricopeptide (TPR) repeat protein